jgi:hypothetical protein
MTYASLISFTLSAKAEATVSVIASLAAGQVVDFATLAAHAGNGKAALATSNLRYRLYECPGLEFALPLHRISSKDDAYGRIDAVACVGEFGRAVKIAVREVKGVFSAAPLGKKEKCPICAKKGVAGCSRLPSQHGLPAPKATTTKKRKGEVKGSEEEAERKRQDAAHARSVSGVDACVMKPLVDAIRTFAAKEGVDAADAYKHWHAIFDEKAADGDGAGGDDEPTAKRQKTSTS